MRADMRQLLIHAGGREKGRANDPPEAAGVKGERPGEEEKRKLYMPAHRTAVPVAPR